MKTFKININSKLQNIKVTVDNGRKFTDACIRGEYINFNVQVDEQDLKRIKKWAVKNANDKSSNYSKWYAHCNGYSMGLFVNYQGDVRVNTYRGYGKETKTY
jgi:hypothetical protein